MIQTALNKKVVVIGAGVAGLSAATTLAKQGFSVTILEKNTQPGGRAGIIKQDGFVFDKGPSWYWMPEIIEKYFNRFGKSASDYFNLIRLDPSYQVIFSNNDVWKLPASYEEIRKEFEQIEKGSALKLDLFMKEAQYKYEAGMNDFVYKPSVSITEFAEWRFIKSLFQLHMFRSFAGHARHYFKESKLLQLLEFPVLFLGAMPSSTPALYSMMNYADLRLGTWYPQGGMYRLVEAMTRLALENGVKIFLNSCVQKIDTNKRSVNRVITADLVLETDIVVAGADYHHVEQDLLGKNSRTYNESYWANRTMAPSCLIYYIGINKKLPRLIHHNLFFEENFEKHAVSIYKDVQWPDNPLFYVCCPSKTDNTVAPEGMENLFVLIPVAAGLQDTEEIRKKYFDRMIKKIEAFCGISFMENIVTQKSYAGSDFVSEYNAFKGNAYGLANTLMQTAFMKPSIKSKKLDNLFFTGQLTVPGPGVPPSIISGQVVADYISGLNKN